MPLFGEKITRKIRRMFDVFFYRLNSGVQSNGFVLFYFLGQSRQSIRMTGIFYKPSSSLGSVSSFSYPLHWTIALVCTYSGYLIGSGLLSLNVALTITAILASFLALKFFRPTKKAKKILREESEIVSQPHTDFQSTEIISKEITSSQPKWALLFPISSKNLTNSECFENISRLCQSIDRTTFEAERKELLFVIGTDVDDLPYRKGAPLFTELVSLLEKLNVQYIWINFSETLSGSGRVCHMANVLAQKAVSNYESLHYFVLVGDDLNFESQGWKSSIERSFQEMFTTNGYPLGCIAFLDSAFLGFPTFPVIHRTHFDIFETLFPESFINQGADPYIFELYRRFGASRFCYSAVINNSIGGEFEARYEKQSIDWKGDILETGIIRVESLMMYKHKQYPKKKLCLDIVVPSFRCSISRLENFIELSVPENVDLTLIFVIDNPYFKLSLSDFVNLVSKLSFRGHLRMHFHSKNLGASAARNTGLDSSSADYVIFLDDDIVPDSDLVTEYAISICENPSAKVLVGNVVLPDSINCWQAAVKGSLAYFFDIALKMEHPPWGVTANLCVVGRQDIRFDTIYPKSGGGEDIDFCFRILENPLKESFSVQRAVVSHEFWKSPLKQICGWAIGDSLCFRKLPSNSFQSVPNAPEYILLLFLAIFGIRFHQVCFSDENNSFTSYLSHISIISFLRILISVLIISYAITSYRLWNMNSGRLSFLECIHGSSYVHAQEITRVCLHVWRGDFDNITRRIDFMGVTRQGNSRSLLVFDAYEYSKFGLFLLATWMHM